VLPDWISEVTGADGLVDAVRDYNRISHG